MAETSYDGWVPFTNETANFSDCNAAASWLAAYFYNNVGSTVDFPLISTYNYTVSLVPSGSEVPTLGQFAAWFMDLGDDSSLFDAMIYYPYSECAKDFCRSLTWTGDADLAGIGVMIVYYLAAALVSVYFVLLSIDQWHPFRRLEGYHRHWTWFVGAFSESLPTFVDTCLIFCISMNASAVYRHGSARMHPDKTHSLYQLTNSTYIGIFTVFPPLLLQLVTHHRRRMRIRATLWLTIIGLVAANLGLYFSLTTSAGRLSTLLVRSAAMADMAWEIDCEPFGVRDALDDALYAAAALLGINFILWAYHTFQPVWTRDRIRGAVLGHTKIGNKVNKMTEHGRTWWENVQRVGKIIDGLLCGLLMWTLLALYTTYRKAVTEAMGNDNVNLQWSFSQVLSLATWVPVVIDLICIYLYGAKDALEAKVSETYRVIENEEKNAAIMYPAEKMYQSTALDPYQVVDPQTAYRKPEPYDADAASRSLLRE